MVLSIRFMNYEIIHVGYNIVLLMFIHLSVNIDLIKNCLSKRKLSEFQKEH